jgi:addiction module HigA family antidote
MGNPGPPPIHPGEHLREELDELGMSARAFALALNIPVNRVAQILRGERGISVDTALRLARYFGTSPSFGFPSNRCTNCGGHDNSTAMPFLRR